MEHLSAHRRDARRKKTTAETKKKIGELKKIYNDYNQEEEEPEEKPKKKPEKEKQ